MRQKLNFVMTYRTSCRLLLRFEVAWGWLFCRRWAGDQEKASAKTRRAVRNLSSLKWKWIARVSWPMAGHLRYPCLFFWFRNSLFTTQSPPFFTGLVAAEEIRSRRPPPTVGQPRAPKAPNPITLEGTQTSYLKLLNYLRNCIYFNKNFVPTLSREAPCFTANRVLL